MEETGPIAEQLAAFGVRLGELRAARCWTLEELAERTGLSKAFLSRLEAGDRQASIAVVLTLARTYGVSVAEMFQGPQDREPCVIIRGGRASPVRGDGLSYWPLSSKRQFATLEPMRLIVSHRRQGDEMYQHEGEEWVYVLSGRLRLALGGKMYDLAATDAAHFDSRQPHRLSALDGKDAELILVACRAHEPAVSLPRRLRPKRAIEV